MSHPVTNLAESLPDLREESADLEKPWSPPLDIAMTTLRNNPDTAAPTGIILVWRDSRQTAALCSAEVRIGKQKGKGRSRGFPV